MIDPNDKRLSLVRQCKLMGVSRSTYYYRPGGENPLNLAPIRMIDEQYLRKPWYGSRQMARHLRRQGYYVGRKRVRRLIRLTGLVSVALSPNTSRKSTVSSGVPVFVARSRY